MERDERTSSIGPTGVMAMACTHRRPDATRETPAVIIIRINWQLVREGPGRVGWRSLAIDAYLESLPHSSGIIMQNFVGTLVVDSVGVGMAAFGFLNPLLAAFIHVTSELAFILNSTRVASWC
jgi:hypothetical protein